MKEGVRRRLAAQNGCCILCGTPIWGTPTREHLVLNAVKFSRRKEDFVFIAHDACNAFRGCIPVIAAMTLLDRSLSRDPVRFTGWANGKAGNSIPCLTPDERRFVKTWRSEMNDRFNGGKI